MACIGECPTGQLPDDENVCHPTLCSGFMYQTSSGSCVNASVVLNEKIMPWPYRKVYGIDGKEYVFGGGNDYVNETLRIGCPAVLGFQCYTQCPPGYMTREVYRDNSYINMECHPCTQYGLHGWYGGRCYSACPFDMVSEGSICVPKCSPGRFDDSYFCLPSCKNGYAFGRECVKQCPSGFIIGRDIKRCFHDCPVNMRIQDGVCVYYCDKGMEYNETTGKCSPCSEGYGWLNRKCVSITSQECPY